MYTVVPGKSHALRIDYLPNLQPFQDYNVSNFKLKKQRLENDKARPAGETVSFYELEK